MNFDQWRDEYIESCTRERLEEIAGMAIGSCACCEKPVLELPGYTEPLITPDDTGHGDDYCELCGQRFGEW